jgi:hypothetical protein
LLQTRRFLSTAIQNCVTPVALCNVLAEPDIDCRLGVDIVGNLVVSPTTFFAGGSNLRCSSDRIRA